MKKLKAASKALEYKSFRKEDAELRAASARRRLSEEEQELASIEETLARTVDMLRGGKGGSIMNVHEFELVHNYCLHLGGRADTQRARKEQSVRELAETQAALVEAHREARLLETLVERLGRERRKKADAADQKEADALYLSRRPNDEA
ncbi:MAG: hypothetical protein Kow0025_04610 [Thermodesulfovibrionales bacterium]